LAKKKILLPGLDLGQKESKPKILKCEINSGKRKKLLDKERAEAEKEREMTYFLD
jgi:hypothetical protein